MLHHADDNLSHGASRLRARTAENLKEDLDLFSQGVLDWKSFLSGYDYHNHPVEAIHTDKHGNLKSIRRTHNLRTNKGGIDQASVMSGTTTPGKAQYIALATATISPLDTDTYLMTTGSAQAEETSASLARTLASYIQSVGQQPSGVGSSTAQGTYQLSVTWTNIQVAKTVYGCGVFGGTTVGTPGSDLWFEAALGSSIGVSIGDNLTLTYTINY